MGSWPMPKAQSTQDAFKTADRGRPLLESLQKTQLIAAYHLSIGLFLFLPPVNEIKVGVGLYKKHVNIRQVSGAYIRTHDLSNLILLPNSIDKSSHPNYG